MSIPVRRSYWCPRWLYYNAMLPAAAGGVAPPQQVPPSAFANESPYWMRLVFMSFGSDYTKNAFLPWNPNPMTRILVELGKSGCSDQNLVAGNIMALTSPGRRYKQIYGAFNVGNSIRLPHSYCLPRDEGLTVGVARITTELLTIPRMTFSARGFGDDGWPGILAGELDTATLAGTQFMDSADLFNRGRKELWVNEMTMMSAVDTQAEGAGYQTDALAVGYQINPTQGTQWMPGPNPIPVGLIAPQTRPPDFFDASPRAYWFPEDVWLAPKQRMSVKLTNLDGTDRSCHVCLFGELEVQ